MNRVKMKVEAKVVHVGEAPYCFHVVQFRGAGSDSWIKVWPGVGSWGHPHVGHEDIQEWARNECARVVQRAFGGTAELVFLAGESVLVSAEDHPEQVWEPGMEDWEP